MSDKRPPRDPNQLAKYIVDVTSGEAEKIEPRKKDSAAVELGRRGGQSKRQDPQQTPLANQAKGNRQEGSQSPLE